MFRSKERLIASLGVIATLFVLTLCLYVDAPYPLDRLLTRWAGFFLVAVGMLLVLWAITYVGKAFGGEIAPVLDYFVAQGPYRYLRHPVYLGLTTALVGLTLAFDNWLATIAVFALFLPSQIARARLEERLLAQQFGMAYEAYRRHTGFLLPRLRKDQQLMIILSPGTTGTQSPLRTSNGKTSE